MRRSSVSRRSFSARAAGDRAGLGVRLADDRLGLLARLLAQLLGGALGGDERRPQQALELLVADEVDLELLDLVGEVGALAPDVLEAVGDLDEQRVDRVPLVAEKAAAELEVADLDRCECHRASLPTAAGAGTRARSGRSGAR